MLCTYDAMYNMYMQFYLHMALCACCTSCIMYIYCCVHDYTCGVVCMWFYVHLVHVVFLIGGMCTYHACDVLYMCYHVHVMHGVLCRCGIVYMYRWCSVHVEMCMHCTCGVVYM